MRLPLGDVAAILSESSGVQVSEANLVWHVRHNKAFGRLYRLGRAKSALNLAQSAYSLAVDSQTVSALQYFEKSRGLLESLPQVQSGKGQEELLDPVPVVLLPDNHRGDCTLPSSSENKLEELLGDDLGED